MLKRSSIISLLLIFCSYGIYAQTNDDWEKLIDDGVIAYKAGNYDEAIAITKKASEIIASELGKDDPAYSTALSNLGTIYKKKGLLSEAEEMYTKALTVIESAKGNNKLTFQEKMALEQAYEYSVQDLANLYKQMGRYQEANNLLRSLNQEEEQAKVENSEAGRLYGELNALMKNKDYDGAERKVLEIVKLQEEEYGTKHPNYAKAITRQGIILQVKGKYNETEALFEKAKTIYFEKFGQVHPDYATTLNNLASLYTTMGRYKEAEKLYEESIGINQQIYGGSHILYANSLNNLVTLYYELGENERALPLAEESHNIIKNALGTESEPYINALNTLAGIYFAVGNTKEAEDMMQESLTINEKLYGKNNEKYAATLNNLANLCYQEGQYERAEKYYKLSLTTYRYVLGEDHIDYLVPLFKLAQVYFAQQKDELAEPLYLEGIRRIHKQIKLYFPALSESEKTLFYRAIQKYFDEFNTFAIYRYQGKPAIAADIYNNQLKTKAILLNASNKIRKHIMASGDKALINLYKKLLQKRDELVKVYTMNVEEQKKAGIKLDVLEKNVKNIERQLSLKSEEFAKESEQSEYTWQDIKNKLSEKEAAIEIIRFNDFTDQSVKYAFLTITGGAQQKPEMTFIDGQKLEERYIKYYKNSIKFMNLDKVSYNYFWRFIDTKLNDKGIRKAYVSVDGIYNQINLNTLYDSEREKYILEKSIDYQMLSNTKDFLNFKPTIYTKKTLSKKVMIIGNPNFDYEDEAQGEKSAVMNSKMKNELLQNFSGGHIAPLPGTAVEVVNIKKSLKKNKIKAYTFTEEDASELKVKSLKNPKILHIATHGFFLGDAGGSNADKPLLRSGILLTQTKKTSKKFKGVAEDGILTSFEAMTLELNNTDLVIISACETGLGEIRNGEGVYGLQRAFQVAGSKSTMMSLWKVNDKATQELMSAFYGYLIQTQNIRSAFKQAQKDLLKEYKHPNYWGAFVFVGQ